MSRIELLPERQLVSMINDLQRDVQEIKAIQSIGASSIAAYPTATGNVWDINGVAVPAYQSKSFVVTFNSNAGQNDNPFIEFMVLWVVNNQNGYESAQWFPDASNQTSKTARSYRLIFDNDSNNTTFFARFAVISTHKGSISVQAL